MAAPAELLILSENDVRIALSRIETLEASRDAFLAVTPPTSDSANTNAAVVPTSCTSTLAAGGEVEST